MNIQSDLYVLLPELILAIILLLLFGGNRFSSMMGDVAKGIKSFKQGMADEYDDKYRRFDEQRRRRNPEACVFHMLGESGALAAERAQEGKDVLVDDSEHLPRFEQLEPRPA